MRADRQPGTTHRYWSRANTRRRSASEMVAVTRAPATMTSASQRARSASGPVRSRSMPLPFCVLRSQSGHRVIATWYAGRVPLGSTASGRSSEIRHSASSTAPSSSRSPRSSSSAALAWRSSAACRWPVPAAAAILTRLQRRSGCHRPSVAAGLAMAVNRNRHDRMSGGRTLGLPTFLRSICATCVRARASADLSDARSAGAALDATSNRAARLPITRVQARSHGPTASAGVDRGARGARQRPPSRGAPGDPGVARATRPLGAGVHPFHGTRRREQLRDVTNHEKSRLGAREAAPRPREGPSSQIRGSRRRGRPRGSAVSSHP